MRRLVVTALGVVLALVPALLRWTVGQAHVVPTLWGSPASDPRHLEIFVAAAGGLGRRLLTWSRAAAPTR